MAQSQNMQLQLTPSNFNGYQISCFGLKDGSINLTVSGGTAPYQYRWSNGALTEDISDLPAGYYNVDVLDANNDAKQAEITLEEPLQIRTELTPSVYSNGYNISCYSCGNGSITSTVSGGALPYTYNWSPGGQSTASISLLEGGEYTLLLTDANQCIDKAGALLTEPERDDWTMGGNANTNPSTHFIGTTDNQPIAFRTNNTEALRIASNGNIGIGTTNPIERLHINGDLRIEGLAFQPNSNPDELRLVLTNSSGKLRTEDYPIGNIQSPLQACEGLAFWINNSCIGFNPNNIYNDPLIGNVGIGFNNPTEKLSVNGNIHLAANMLGKRTTGALFISGNTGSNDGGTIELYGPDNASGGSSSEVHIVGNSVEFYDYENSNWNLNMTINQIGEVDMANNLDVAGTINVTGNSNNDWGAGWGVPIITPAGSAWRQELNNNEDYLGLGMTDNGFFWISSNSSASNAAIEYPMILYTVTTTGIPRLEVRGDIRTVKAIVNAQWWDSVFSPEYIRMSWQEKESFYKTNGQLPYVPSEKLIEEDGLDVGIVMSGMMRNLEEDRLDITELYVLLDELRNDIDFLSKENAELKLQIIGSDE